MKSSNPNCQSCICFKYSLLRSCTGEEMDNIADNKSSRVYSKNQVLYVEGEKPQGIFCVYSGKIKIIKNCSSGKEQIIKIIKSGENLGYHALLNGDRHIDSAVAIEDSEVCFIPKSDFLNLITNNPEASSDLLRRLSYDFTEAENLLKIMSLKPVRERMADALLHLKNIYNHIDESELSILISRADLTNMVGTSKETTARLLSDFNRENIIEPKGRVIKVIDWNKLRKISQFYE